jgi:hypothetical protein
MRRVRRKNGCDPRPNRKELRFEDCSAVNIGRDVVNGFRCFFRRVSDVIRETMFALNTWRDDLGKREVKSKVSSAACGRRLDELIELGPMLVGILVSNVLPG